MSRRSRQYPEEEKRKGRPLTHLDQAIMTAILIISLTVRRDPIVREEDTITATAAGSLTPITAARASQGSRQSPARGGTGE